MDIPIILLQSKHALEGSSRKFCLVDGRKMNTHIWIKKAKKENTQLNRIYK